MPLNRMNFLAALASAKKGQKIIYHTGSLMFDRLTGETFAAVHATGDAAFEAYKQGRCILVQRHLGPLMTDYIAIKQ